MLSESLLNRIKLDQILLHAGLLLDPVRSVVILQKLLKFTRKVVHLVHLVRLLDVSMWLHGGAAMVGHTCLWSRRVLLGIVRMFYQRGAIRLTEAALDIFPQVMEVHNLVVLELVLVDTHLLVVHLLKTVGPFIRLR